MADTQFHALPTKAAPNDWVLPDSVAVQLKAARAVFDGTSSGSSFLPAVEIISDSGNPVGTYVTSTAVAAGSAADVSFGPFLKGAQASVTGTGLRYDVDNTGDWFYADANAANDVSGAAWEFFDNGASGFGIYIHSANGRIDLAAGNIGHFGSQNRLELDSISGPVLISGNASDAFSPTAVYATVPDGQNIELNAGTGVNNSRFFVGGLVGNPEISGISGEVVFNLNGGTGAGTNAFVVNDGTNPQFEVRKDGNVFMPHLPTADPGTHDGRIWSNGGVLTLTS